MSDEQLARVPQARVIGVPGAKHLFVGFTEEVLDLVVGAIDPSRGPLARSVPPELVDSGGSDLPDAAFPVRHGP